MAINKFNVRAWISLTVILLCTALSLSGCKHTDAALASDSELLWRIANEAFESEDWPIAQIRFNKFKQFYGDDARVPVARLRLAQSAFHERKYVDAEVYFKDFIDMHPSHPKGTYAHFMLAESQKNQVPSFISRDLSMAKTAIKSYGVYLARPDVGEPDVKLAQSRIEELEIKLLTKHYDIGDWYYRTGRYESAFQRFKDLLEQYQHLASASPQFILRGGQALAVSALTIGEETVVRQARGVLLTYKDKERWSSELGKLNSWIQTFDASESEDEEYDEDEEYTDEES